MLLAISALSFSLIYASAGNIARNILGPTATEAQVSQRAAELGLDRPLVERYAEWLLHAIQGDLGTSWFSPELVTNAITARMGVTLSLVIGTTLIAAVLAVALGIAAAVRRGWLDRLVQVLAIVGFAVPGFLVALGLVLALSIQLGWFPATGYVQPAQSLTGWIHSITLPIAALSIGAIATIAQQVRGSALDILERDFVRTLRVRGLPERTVIFTHVLRNAAGPALAVMALQFVGLLGGAVIVEQMFAIPGIGQLSVTSTTRGDVPVVMGVVIVMAIVVLIVNLLIDLLQGWLNPKARAL